MSSARGVENIKTIYDLILFFFRSDVTVTFEDGLFPLVYFLAFNLKVTKDLQKHFRPQSLREGKNCVFSPYLIAFR